MLKLFDKLFNQVSARELAQRELEMNQRALLSHESSTAYHTKMKEYCQENIVRLRGYLKTA